MYYYSYCIYFLVFRLMTLRRRLVFHFFFLNYFFFGGTIQFPFLWFSCDRLFFRSCCRPPRSVEAIVIKMTQQRRCKLELVPSQNFYFLTYNHDCCFFSFLFPLQVACAAVATVVALTLFVLVVIEKEPVTLHLIPMFVVVENRSNPHPISRLFL